MKTSLTNCVGVRPSAGGFATLRSSAIANKCDVPLLCRISKSDKEGTSYEFGGFTILFTALAARQLLLKSRCESTLVAVDRRLLPSPLQQRDRLRAVLFTEALSPAYARMIRQLGRASSAVMLSRQNCRCAGLEVLIWTAPASGISDLRDGAASTALRLLDAGFPLWHYPVDFSADF